MHRLISRKGYSILPIILTFLFVFAGISVNISSFQQGEKNLGRPEVSQVPIVEFSQSIFTNFTIIQGQDFQINCTVLGGLGKSYRVTQTGELITILINFGIINDNLFYIYAPVNSSQLGTFTVLVEIYNASYNTHFEFILFVKPNLDLSMPQVVLIVVGSVTVAVISTIAIERRRNRREPKTKRELNAKLFKTSTDLDTALTPEDLTFISSTAIDAVAIVSSTLLEGWVWKKFRKLEPDEIWDTEIIKKVRSLSTQVPYNNVNLKINDFIRYLTCFRYGVRERVILVVSTEILSDRFLSILFSSIKMLAKRDFTLIDSPTDFLEELTRILYLERSYNYLFPGTTKIAHLERSRFWNSRGAPAEDIQSSEMKEIEEDLQGMTLESVDAMVTFMDRMEKEFEPISEKESE